VPLKQPNNSPSNWLQDWKLWLFAYRVAGLISPKTSVANIDEEDGELGKDAVSAFAT